MGYELVEQLGWEYPDAVFYPTGGGVGLIGMWKAFEEMEALGWVSRQAAPHVRAAGFRMRADRQGFRQQASVSEFFANAVTFAAGLRVPKPYGDTIILQILAESGGNALDLSDEVILGSLLDWAHNEGILLSPEGAAATAAYDYLICHEVLKESERVVIFNTGAGLKYADVIAEAMKIDTHTGVDSPRASSPPEMDHRGLQLPAKSHVGGIITPQ